MLLEDEFIYALDHMYTNKSVRFLTFPSYNENGIISGYWKIGLLNQSDGNKIGQISYKGTTTNYYNNYASVCITIKY